MLFFILLGLHVELELVDDKAFDFSLPLLFVIDLSLIMSNSPKTS